MDSSNALTTGDGSYFTSRGVLASASPPAIVESCSEHAGSWTKSERDAEGALPCLAPATESPPCMSTNRNIDLFTAGMREAQILSSSQEHDAWFRKETRRVISSLFVDPCLVLYSTVLCRHGRMKVFVPTLIFLSSVVPAICSIGRCLLVRSIFHIDQSQKPFPILDFHTPEGDGSRRELSIATCDTPP